MKINTDLNIALVGQPYFDKHILALKSLEEQGVTLRV